MPPLKKDQIIIRISSGLKQQLERKAKEKEMSVSELIRLLIIKLLDEDKSSNT